MHELMGPILLVILAVGVVGVEALVPSMGLLGLLAAGLFGTALWQAFGIGMGFGCILLVAGAAGCAGAYYFTLTRLAPRLGLIPGDPAPLPRHESLPPPGVCVGEEGITEGALRPHGAVRIGGLRCEAFCESGLVAAGTRVRVTRIDGMRVMVEPTQGQVSGQHT